MNKPQLIVLLVACLLFAGCSPTKSTDHAVPSPLVTRSLSPSPVVTPLLTQSPSPTLTVITTVEHKCSAGETAFSALESGHKLTFAQSAQGKVVTSIDDEVQGGGKFWQFSLKGKETTVSADNYKCEGNEIIRWELK